MRFGEIGVMEGEMVVMDVQVADALRRSVGDVEPWDGVVRIYDPAGVEQDAVWLRSWFGGMVGIVEPVVPEDAEYVVRCVELRTKDGEAAQVVTVQDVVGMPMVGAAVARWWSTAPDLPDFPGDCVASRWYTQGVIGLTDGPEGAVGFGMGNGDCPPGSSAVWVVHCEAASELVEGLGWGVGEAHRVVRPVFRVVPVGDGEDGGGEVGLEGAVLAVADQVEALVRLLGTAEWVVRPRV